jgi:hypothetical protein
MDTLGLIDDLLRSLRLTGHLEHGDDELEHPAWSRLRRLPSDGRGPISSLYRCYCLGQPTKLNPDFRVRTCARQLYWPTSRRTFEPKGQRVQPAIVSPS